MHLEISARSSGKTQRMRKEIVRFLDASPNNFAILICENAVKAANLAFVMTQEQDKKHRIIVADTMCGNLPEQIQNQNEVRFFVDNFDYIDASKLVLLDNAYYVTHVSRRRKRREIDFLTSVFQFCCLGGIPIESYSYGGDHIQLRKNLGRSEYLHAINREVYQD